MDAFELDDADFVLEDLEEDEEDVYDDFWGKE